MSCDKNKSFNCCKSKLNDSIADHLVCTCMGVMYTEICEAIDRGIDTFEGLSEQLGVGTGCSSCVAEVRQILESRLRLGCCKS